MVPCATTGRESEDRARRGRSVSGTRGIWTWVARLGRVVAHEIQGRGEWVHGFQKFSEAVLEGGGRRCGGTGPGGDDGIERSGGGRAAEIRDLAGGLVAS